jgi:Cu-Zn family superoxide dismutase
MKLFMFVLFSLLISSNSLASVTVPMSLVDNKGIIKLVGNIEITESSYGLVFTPLLSDLPPGLHGFHMHQNPSCLAMEKDGQMVTALAAGGHFDPLKTEKHDYPWADGHLGDLPALYVDASGMANQAVLAPRLKMNDISNHALMIHTGADNHSDHPLPLGGGGARIACGIIK